LQSIERSNIETILAAHPGNRLFLEALKRVESGDDLLCILGRYIHFNSVFGSSVASLASKIAARQDLFRDADELIEIIADRSVEVAADIFFAAIDEFGGHITNHRKTHRSLAQATLKASGTFFGLDTAQINNVVCLNESTRVAIRKVQDGYGVSQMMNDHKIFHSIGFHLGSELLADEEFRILDKFLRTKYPDLVKYLEKTRVAISGSQYAAYYWIRIHTSVEAEHFDVAVKGANCALKYYAGRESIAELKSWIIEGFRDFAAVQAEFMAAW
jgi:hypothetical protein